MPSCCRQRLTVTRSYLERLGDLAIAQPALDIEFAEQLLGVPACARPHQFPRRALVRHVAQTTVLWCESQYETCGQMWSTTGNGRSCCQPCPLHVGSAAVASRGCYPTTNDDNDSRSRFAPRWGSGPLSRSRRACGRQEQGDRRSLGPRRDGPECARHRAAGCRPRRPCRVARRPAGGADLPARRVPHSLRGGRGPGRSRTRSRSFSARGSRGGIGRAPSR
jgi:hypothetical protein